MSVLLPPIAFLVMLALAWGIMWFAKGLAPKSRPEHGKFRHYACGEDMEMGPIQPNYSRFFIVAFAYSMIHVAALMIITIPSGVGALIGAVYLSIVFFAAMAFITELKLI